MLEIPIEYKLYCFKHGVARLQTNVLVYFYSFFSIRSKEKQLYRNKLANSLNINYWNEKTNIIWHQTKPFLLEKKWIGIETFFNKIEARYYYENNTFVLSEMFTIVMESLSIFLAFAYIKWQSQTDFKYLVAAAKSLKWVFFQLNWIKITPSNHFMLYHSVSLSIYHHTAHNSLQEGVEKKHDFIKHFAEHTFKGEIKDSANRYVLILKHILISSLICFHFQLHSNQLTYLIKHKAISDFEFFKINSFLEN